MVHIHESMKKILDVAEEKDKEIIDKISALKNNKDAAFLALIAPYVSVRISPSKEISASIGLSEEFGVESVIEQIKDCKSCKTLFLLLNSPGGLVQSSYKVARALRKNFERIIVFIPHIAASGGTLIALTGNEIVMGLMSQLTPLDPHSDGESALSIIRGFENVTNFFKNISEEDAPYSYKVLAEKYHAVQIDEAISSMELMKEYIVEILENTKYDKDEASKIANKLVGGFKTHGDVINIDRAKGVGLKVVENTKYSDMWNIFRIWLGKYLLTSADKHIIRYHIPAIQTKLSKEKEVCENEGEKND